MLNNPGYEQARELLLARVSPVEPERVPLSRCGGRVLAREAAAQGIAAPLVHQKARVAVLSTGSELVEADGEPGMACAYGTRLASMRIVPLVTEETRILKAERLCRGRTLFGLRPYRHRSIGVIITGSEVYHGRVQDKFEPVVRKKMEAYPSELIGVTACDDDLDRIVNAAKGHLERGADFLIFTGGMPVDPDDLTPSAIRALGADIVSHGVPSRPGNMTLVAYLGGTAILGVPGAAISLPTTVFDVLLPQIFAGDRLTKDDLIRLGGGLCQLCGDCRWPNCTFGRY